MAEPARLTQLDLVIQQSLSIVETSVDTAIANIAGMPAIKSYGTGDPSLVKDSEFPTIRASGIMTPKVQVAGRSFEPQYSVDFIVAYKERGTDEAYLDGCRLADLIMQAMLAMDVNPPYWRYIVRQSCRLAPAANPEANWQGGVFSCTILGDEVTWT